MCQFHFLPEASRETVTFAFIYFSDRTAKYLPPLQVTLIPPSLPPGSSYLAIYIPPIRKMSPRTWTVLKPKSGSSYPAAYSSFSWDHPYQTNNINSSNSFLPNSSSSSCGCDSEKTVPESLNSRDELLKQKKRLSFERGHLLGKQMPECDVFSCSFKSEE